MVINLENVKDRDKERYNKTFRQLKPGCDRLLKDSLCLNDIDYFISLLTTIDPEGLKANICYVLTPYIWYFCPPDEKKRDPKVTLRMVETLTLIAEQSQLSNHKTVFPMYVKLGFGLNRLLVDGNEESQKKILDVSEEFKSKVLKCLTALLLSLDTGNKIKLFKDGRRLLANILWTSAMLAKQEKSRELRLLSLRCLMAYVGVHEKLTDNECHITDPTLEDSIVSFQCNIMPGVLLTLVNVAGCPNNPGHAVIVTAVKTMHRLLYMAFDDKYLPKQKQDFTTQDFMDLYAVRTKPKTDKDDRGEKGEDKKIKKFPVRSPEWYEMTGEKLNLTLRKMSGLRMHEHFEVRKEMAVFCQRLLKQCYRTMARSITLLMDTLLTLSKDEYPEVAEYSANAIGAHFSEMSPECKRITMDAMTDKLFVILNYLSPTIKEIDSSNKLSALNLLHSYMEKLCYQPRPQQLTIAVSMDRNMRELCSKLQLCAEIETGIKLLVQATARDVKAPAPTDSPWCKFKNIDTPVLRRRLVEICQVLASAECVEIILDKLFHIFQVDGSVETVCIMNWLGSAPNCPEDVTRRILDTYLNHTNWYKPLALGKPEPPINDNDHSNLSQYTLFTDNVPGLYEGAYQIRYTDISYQTPRVQYFDPDKCRTLGEAQTNMATLCLLTEGVGMMARRLGEGYQPYMMKTLSLILERIGSKYEMLHLAGMKALSDIACACGHQSTTELIRANTDYLTYQISVKLKKEWQIKSGLEILSVVMEYSDENILHSLYGILNNVLIHSFEKHYNKNQFEYLLVFNTFVKRIRQLFTTNNTAEQPKEYCIMNNVIEFVKNKELVEKLLNEDMEKTSGKSAEEMWREDMEKRENEDVLDYDDKVTEEKPPVPEHIIMMRDLLKKCSNFVAIKMINESILALETIEHGLHILKGHDDELLPLIHTVWEPLVTQFQTTNLLVLRRSLLLFVTMVTLSKDFLRSRAIKDVLPRLYKHLHDSAAESRLKDARSSYRTSHAYQLQLQGLAALGGLAVALQLADDSLTQAMSSVDHYLSDKQPKPLQEHAVKFYKVVSLYDYGAVWYHLREVCDNKQALKPPNVRMFRMEPVKGTPYEANNAELKKNIKLIFS